MFTRENTGWEINGFQDFWSTQNTLESQNLCKAFPVFAESPKKLRKANFQRWLSKRIPNNSSRFHTLKSMTFNLSLSLHISGKPLNCTDSSKFWFNWHTEDEDLYSTISLQNINRTSSMQNLCYYPTKLVFVNGNITKTKQYKLDAQSTASKISHNNYVFYFCFYLYNLFIILFTNICINELSGLLD